MKFFAAFKQRFAKRKIATAIAQVPLTAGEDLEGAIALRAALAYLMNPRGMGGFAVELFALGTPEHRSRLADPVNPLPGATAPIRPLV